MTKPLSERLLDESHTFDTFDESSGETLKSEFGNLLREAAARLKELEDAPVVGVLATIRRWKHELCGTGTEELHAAEQVIVVAINALKDVDHVVQQWSESGREPAYGQWLNVQDVVRDALRLMGEHK